MRMVTVILTVISPLSVLWLLSVAGDGGRWQLGLAADTSNSWQMPEPETEKAATRGLSESQPEPGAHRDAYIRDNLKT